VSFDPAPSDSPGLAQEQVAETLKRLRTGLVTRGTRNAVHDLLPVAVAPAVDRFRRPNSLHSGA
jgi:Arc/MetJ family transcription regulator